MKYYRYFFSCRNWMLMIFAITFSFFVSFPRNSNAESTPVNDYSLSRIGCDIDDYNQRDQSIVQADKIFNYCCGFGISCLAGGALQSNPIYQIGAGFLGAAIFAAGSLFKYRTNQAADIFNGINGPHRESSFCDKDVLWKDGTYNVDRYPITPIGISWNHALQATNLEANYTIQFAKFIAYRLAHTMMAKEPSEQEIIDYALNSTILTLVDVEQYEDRLIINLDIKDLSSPFFEDGRKTDLFVSFEIPKDDFSLSSSKITTFSFDGIDITQRSEQLLVLSTVTALYIHPTLHSFSNGMYRSYSNMSTIEKEKWNDLFIHGQYLNSVAHTYPADNIGIERTVAQKIYRENVSKDLHDHSKPVRLLSKYSRFSRFLLGIRKTIHEIVKKHEVPVNPEEFFLNSVMHSLDHLTTGKALLYRNLDTDKLRPQANPHMLNYMWYLPSENVFTNLLKDKKDKNGFYRDLYKAAKKLDPEYADHLTLSISY